MSTQFWVIIIKLRLNSGIRGLKIVLWTNLEPGPRFAEVWSRNIKCLKKFHLRPITKLNHFKKQIFVNREWIVIFFWYLALLSFDLKSLSPQTHTSPYILERSVALSLKHLWFSVALVHTLFQTWSGMFPWFTKYLKIGQQIHNNAQQ